MVGQGLLTGMGITIRRFFGKKMTVQYPEEKLPMSERFRGGALDVNLEKCISCGLCAMACPNNAIRLASEIGEDKKKRLTAYRHLGGQCLYCNMCLEACPTKALSWDKNYERSCYLRADLEFDCLARGRERARANLAAPVEELIAATGGGTANG